MGLRISDQGIYYVKAVHQYICNQMHVLNIINYYTTK